MPLVIIVITTITSYLGFQNRLNNQIFDRFCLHIGSILGNDKQWDRLFSSALVHVDWMHLLFNMMTLWFLGPFVVASFGVGKFLIIYFGAVLGGSLLACWRHRKNYYYRAVGASGGVIGVVFAMITIAPHAGLGFFFIPIAIPAWLFGVMYLSVSIYALRTNNMSNIGHDAHIGGALVGLIITLIYAPDLIIHNGLYIIINLIPLSYFAYSLWKEK